MLNSWNIKKEKTILENNNIVFPGETDNKYLHFTEEWMTHSK